MGNATNYSSQEICKRICEHQFPDHLWDSNNRASVKQFIHELFIAFKLEALGSKLDANSNRLFWRAAYAFNKHWFYSAFDTLKFELCKNQVAITGSREPKDLNAPTTPARASRFGTEDDLFGHAIMVAERLKIDFDEMEFDTLKYWLNRLTRDA